MRNFSVGEFVVHRIDRSQGVIRSEARVISGEAWYKVQFASGTKSVTERDLEPMPTEDSSLETLASEGKWATLNAFRCAIAVERLTHLNRSTYVSYRSRRIIFQPHQYKPLLKFLDTPDHRLLIADEVGLGKTIEAGLILAELEARHPLDQVLIVCPSRLRDKWREELNRKFGESYEIWGRKELTAYAEKVRNNPHDNRLRAIVSLQVLRAPDLRQEFLAQVGQIGCIVFDEAHHARNPSSQTSQMLAELCEMSTAVLLLTATPIHLKSRDLFTLIASLRPSEFRDPNAFDQLLKESGALHTAAAHVRTQKPDELTAAAALIRKVLGTSAEDQRLQHLNWQLTESPPETREEWLDLERQIQELHPLAGILTRTRKRDVLIETSRRDAETIRCEWTDEEDDLYQRLIGSSRRRGWLSGQPSFTQVLRARQAASCLPAAIQAARLRLEDGTGDDELCDIDLELYPSLEPGQQASQHTSSTLPDPITDSKYDSFQQRLEYIWSEPENQKQKVLVFAYFLGTAQYLHERLTRSGVKSELISGKVPSHPNDPEKDERGKRIARFRDDPSIRVLVSTEVGSEGLDFQFCRHIVNYDLPWNPMVLEQRIGRIDRFGQKSPVIHIHNLVVSGTIEDRILARLFERIDIFRQGLGDLEDMLGEIISALERRFVFGKLTPEQADAEVERAAAAVAQKRVMLDQLEQDKSHLLGHEEYINEELTRIGRQGRFVDDRSLKGLMQTYLESEYPGCRLWDEAPGVYVFRMPERLREHVLRTAYRENRWIQLPRADDMLRFTFNGDLAFQDPKLELLNSSHLLVRVAVAEMRKRMEDVSVKLAQAILPKSEQHDDLLSPGLHYCCVFLLTVHGVRARSMFEFIAVNVEQQVLLDADSSERLVFHLLSDGVEWNRSEPATGVDSETWNRICDESIARCQRLRERERSENEALYHRRVRILDQEMSHRRRQVEQRLDTARRDGKTRAAPLFEAQLQKLNAADALRREELDEQRESAVDVSEPLAVCAIWVE